MLIPVTGITVPSWLASLLLHWPRSFVVTYYTVAVTERLGPNLRVLSLLLLPVPLLAWPLLMAVSCLIFSLGVGFLWPLAATVAVGGSLDGEKLLEAAIMQPLELTRHAASEVWRFSVVSYFSYLDELRRPYFGEPLDVSPLRLLFAAVAALCCSLVSTLAVLILGMLRLPFIMARALAEWLSQLTACPTKLACLWLPFWLLGIPAIPVLVLGGFLLLLASCLAYLGPTCGVVAYVAT
ncbi:hypothetical protein GPECTOR_574g620 [Gonium pectorale]|uniref:Uncharacterized protein n=1 Tax=Gonium pectorale TaxID=33097 RepID=A0A150FUJ3_GONPE|nr:hypothetical protein GPECTOR_574g620 [Gonium pectorale]|eukprot:KXZ41291.1 hypothetical protein GPECTOR_574g620 [Gonium pectorale]